MQLAASVNSEFRRSLVREADSAARAHCAALTGRRGGGASSKCCGGDDKSENCKATADHRYLADKSDVASQSSRKVCWRVLT